MSGVLLGDVCSGAGLGADGYNAVGITTEGYDLHPQPHYPYRFTQGDGLAWLRTDEPERYDVRQGCRHDRWPVPEGSTTGRTRPWGVWHVPGDQVPSGGRTARDAEHGREVMGSRRLLPWDSLKEGFPPAYTSYIGARLLVHLRTEAAA